MNFKGVIEDFKEHEIINDLYKRNQQQADRIAELEKYLHILGRHYDKLDNDLINAEPVAWVIGTCHDDYRNPTRCLEQAEEELEHYKKFGDNDDKIVPLYTTPQTKPLSDEEIEQIAVKWYVGTRILPIGFARAIEAKVRGEK